MRLHDDQVDVSPDQVTALIRDQLPHLAHLEVARVRGGDTVHSQLEREATAAREFLGASPFSRRGSAGRRTRLGRV